MISVLVHVIVSLIVSKIGGSNDPKKMNPNLICRPFDHCPCISDETKKILNFHVGTEFRGVSNKSGCRNQSVLFGYSIRFISLFEPETAPQNCAGSNFLENMPPCAIRINYLSSHEADT